MNRTTLRRAATTLAAALLSTLAATGCATSGNGDSGHHGEFAHDEAEARPRPSGDLAQAEVLFARGVELRAAGEWGDARDAFRDVFEDYPASPRAPEAQFQAAECAYGDERYFAAGNAFARYIQDRPLSPYVNTVEKRLYDIGSYLIEDGELGLWGSGWFKTSEEGVTILRKLTSLLPTGTWADDALMRIGRHRADQRDFEGAEMTLEELLRNYTDSEWRLEARFLLAWTYRKDNRGPEYDGEKLKRARAHFSAFMDLAARDAVQAEDNAERIDAARAEIDLIDEDLALKAIARARFYERNGRTGAARWVLEDASQRWGSTEAGREAARKAAELGTD